MSGYNYFDVPHAVKKPKVLWDYKSTSDIHSASAVTANVWNNLGPLHTFTVENASSVIEILVGGGGVITSATAASSWTQILVDGVTTRPLGGSYNPAAAFTNPLSGSVPIYLTGLSPGSHTLQVQVQANNTAALYYRGAAFPDKEVLQVKVREHQPPGAYWGNSPPRDKTGLFIASRASDTVAANTPERIDLNVVERDSEGWFGSFRYVPQIEGWYQFNWRSQALSAAINQYAITFLYRNGVLAGWGSASASPSASYGMSSTGSGIVYADGIDDYFELWVQTSVTTVTLSHFSGSLVEAV